MHGNGLVITIPDARSQVRFDLSKAAVRLLPGWRGPPSLAWRYTQCEVRCVGLLGSGGHDLCTESWACVLQPQYAAKFRDPARVAAFAFNMTGQAVVNEVGNCDYQAVAVHAGGILE